MKKSLKGKASLTLDSSNFTPSNSGGKIMGKTITDPEQETFKAVLASSRPIQAILSIAQPGFAALVALKRFPDPITLAIAIPAAAAGFFAVFALNDFWDIDVDQARFSNLRTLEGFDIDTFIVRHPYAQGIISFKQQVSWILFNLTVASFLAYLLNPISMYLFWVSILLETLYCKLKKVTYLKFLATGAMVACGALAGYFAVVDLSQANWGVVGSLFLLFFAWEIGGRNIVNDFSDIEEDQSLGIKTLPSVRGLRPAAWATCLFSLLTIVANIMITYYAGLGWIYAVLSTVVGIWFMFIPQFKLTKIPSLEQALNAFNKGSVFPFVISAILIPILYVPKLLS